MNEQNHMSAYLCPVCTACTLYCMQFCQLCPHFDFSSWLFFFPPEFWPGWCNCTLWQSYKTLCCVSLCCFKVSQETQTEKTGRFWQQNATTNTVFMCRWDAVRKYSLKDNWSVKKYHATCISALQRVYFCFETQLASIKSAEGRSKQPKSRRNSILHLQRLYRKYLGW